MKSNTRYSFRKWFLIGFGLRITFAIVVTLMSLVNFESAMLYFTDLPTILLLTLAEDFLPSSWFTMLVGSDPLYLPMNLAGCLLWGGIFMLIPLARNLVFRLRHKNQTLNSPNPV